MGRIMYFSFKASIPTLGPAEDSILMATGGPVLEATYCSPVVPILRISGAIPAHSCAFMPCTETTLPLV